MAPNREQLLAEIDEVMDYDYAYHEESAPRMSAFLRRILPPESGYRDDILKADHHLPSIRAFELRGVLTMVRRDIESGLLESWVTGIRNETYADLLEMATDLLRDYGKTPAAVVAGITLEEHLRKLCEANGIEIRKANGDFVKVEVMNAALVKKRIYLTTEGKQVTAWYGRRTDAAHGKDDAATEADIRTMIDGVTNFVSQHPA